MPLSEIKSVLEFGRKTNFNDLNTIEKHLEKLSHLMLHLNVEMKETKSILENLNTNEKEALLNKLSPQGLTLVHSLLLNEVNFSFGEDNRNTI